MCGLAGFINSKLIFKELEIDNILKSFQNNLKHRGPDSKGIWKDNVNNIYLAHTRLSINDLSQKGSQPMANESGRHILVFNGEIYNHIQIRDKYLSKFNIKWHSRSDTETLLKSIEFLGLSQTLNLLEGMFAFGIYVKDLQKVFLVRDKFGEKPLYYGKSGESFIFGSELKIFSTFPGFQKKISNISLSLFLKYSYVPEPYSIYENVYKVNPGEVVEVDLKNLNFESNLYINNLTKYKWYDPLKVTNKKTYDKGIFKDFESALVSSVKESLLSDVEVGTFLSGGLDSSVISSIAQKQTNGKIRTFSICFDDNEYNEQKYSRLVSKSINSIHKEFLIKSFNISDYFDRICEVYDEPFADSSQIPTLILSEFTSKYVKVCLTGDGADELFGGYNRYLFTNKIKSNSKYIPKSIKKKLSTTINNLSYSHLTFISNYINKFLPIKDIPQINQKLQKFGQIFDKSENLIDMYSQLIEAPINLNNKIFNYSDDSNFFITKKYNMSNNKENIQDLMDLDQQFYLPGDILHKVDRAAMYYGLETRVPFLNSKVVNFSKNLDLSLKVNGNNNKYILKKIAKNYVPDEIINRNKMGFSVPLDKWIIQDLKNIKLNLLKNKEFLISLGFNYESIIHHLDEHESKKRNWSQLLWNLIIFNKWSTKYVI